MPVTIRSITHRLDEVPRSYYQELTRAAKQRVYEKARMGLDGPDIMLRDLRPSDIGLANEEWTDTSGSVDNAYANTTATGASYILATGVWIVLWGVRLHTYGATTVLGPVITSLRFTVGQNKVAEWNLYPLWETQSPNSDQASMMGGRDGPPAIFTQSPILIVEEEPLQIEHYTISTSETYNIEFLGAVAEKAEKELNPQNVRGIDTKGGF